MTLGLSLYVALERAGTLVSGRLGSTPFSVTDGAIGGCIDFHGSAKSSVVMVYLR